MNDPHALIDIGPPALRSGFFALWLAVTIDAFFTLRDGFGSQEAARGWIEDPGNIFFEAVADQLGYEPAGLRERIREALKGPKKAGRQTWQDRIRNARGDLAGE